MMAESERRGGFGPQAVLLLIALVWGGTFLVTKSEVPRDSRPLAFLAVRFGVGAAVLALLLAARRHFPTRLEWQAGVALGVAVFLGYALQTFGLQTISTTKSAFITALYVPLAPLMQAIVLRERTRLSGWLGIAACYAGLALIAIDEHFSLSFGLGEWLTLGCSVAFALQIALVGLWANATYPPSLALTQLAVVAALSAIGALLLGEPAPRPTAGFFAATAGLGVATALIAIGMNWAQRSVSPTRTAIIFATEPVWAGVAGALAGERQPPTLIAGSALILAGILISELGRRSG